MEIDIHRIKFVQVVLITFVLVIPFAASAQEGLSAEELARKAQDPLADVRAIMTDNTIGFGSALNSTKDITLLTDAEKKQKLIMKSGKI